MTDLSHGNVAIVYPGDHEIRQNATTDNNRLAQVFQALVAAGLKTEPAVYHDDFSGEVRRQLMRQDAVLVWMNPIQDGRDRTILDRMLRDVSASGVFVSTHPDVILKMGTKEVLYHTRHMGWGCDTHLYRSMKQMRRELPRLLAAGRARVLKQYRGNGGNGVWKVQAGTDDLAHGNDGTNELISSAMVRVQHAQRGSVEQLMSLDDFMKQCEPYFCGDGRMIDQTYQERLPEGMVRCYLVHDTVVGFGYQAINALCPAPDGAPPADAPQPGPRLYHPPTHLQFQRLKGIVEQQWVPEMQKTLDISTSSLPILWDCDFLLGAKDIDGMDTYVLCEINVSSVAPFPESAPPYIAQATLSRIRAMR
jgi:hypothetical protein